MVMLVRRLWMIRPWEVVRHALGDAEWRPIGDSCVLYSACLPRPWSSCLSWVMVCMTSRPSISHTELVVVGLASSSSLTDARVGGRAPWDIGPVYIAVEDLHVNWTALQLLLVGGWELRRGLRRWR